MTIKTSQIRIAVCALAVLLYVNVLPNTFFFDDWQQIVENPFLRQSDGLRKIFTTSVWEFRGSEAASNLYRPLMLAAFLLVFQLFGLNPGAYHALSVLVHAGVCLLVYAVIARLSGRPLVAGAAALLFAAHPVHTQTVAWISAYPDLLCTFFSLLAVWLYLRSEEASSRARLALQFLIGAALLVALLAKEIAVALPLLFVCYELLVRRAGWRATLRSLWPAYAAIAASATVYLAARIHVLKALMPAEGHRIPPGEHLWTTLALYFRYVWVQVWPLRLHAFYYLPTNQSPLDVAVLAGLLGVVASGALGWWLYCRRSPEVLAVPLYVLPLAPVFLLPWASLGLLMAEHYLYLSSVGFCWLLAAALVTAGERWGHRPVGALFVLLLVAYSARTLVRNRDWRDEIAFYRLALSESPSFAFGHLYLSEALVRSNRLTEALEPAQTAARLLPSHPQAQTILGYIFWRQGDSEAAIKHFQRAADLAAAAGNRFTASRSLANLSAVYRQGGRLTEGAAALRRALQIDPQFVAAYNDLGYVLLVQDQVEEGILQLRAALVLEPNLAAAHADLGLAHAMKQEWEIALNYLRQAQRLNPSSGEVHARIGQVYLARGELEVARQEFAVALRLDPSNERARAGLGALQQRR